MCLQEALGLKTCYLYCAVDSSVSQHLGKSSTAQEGACRQEELELGSLDSQDHAASCSMEVSALVVCCYRQPSRRFDVFYACFLTVCCDEVVLENACTPAKVRESSGISFQMNLGILEFMWVLSV